MTKSWPPPQIKQFERLKVTDGLLINAQRWQLAHQYHRQYHNACYQSLHQPGIVCGLGVRIIQAPTDVVAKFRDRRWVEIQPGIAIDLFGNFIVVPEAITYRVSSEATTEDSVTVYIVVKFRDPDELKLRGNEEKVTETFRIDEKKNPPIDGDVEVCRIRLKQGKVQLITPPDVFYPDYNQLDLRYRLQAQSRPQAIAQIATYNNSSGSASQLEELMGISPRDSEVVPTVSNLSYFLQSVAGLYPALQGADEVGELTLQPEEASKLLEYDLFFLTSQQFQSLGEPELDSLQQYLKSGGVVVVEASTKGTSIEELSKIKQELENNLIDFPEDEELTQYRHDLEEELGNITAKLQEQIDEVCHIFQDFTDRLKTPLKSLEQLDRNHPIRTKPFLFAGLPQINKHPISIWIGGGIVVVIGNLSSAWGLDEKLSLSRETIRTAQEMGINILHFAWRRRQLTYGEGEVETKTPAPRRDSSPRYSSQPNVLDELL